jgi:hypothetical protein
VVELLADGHEFFPPPSRRSIAVHTLVFKWGEDGREEDVWTKWNLFCVGGESENERQEVVLLFTKWTSDELERISFLQVSDGERHSPTQKPPLPLLNIEPISSNG